MTEQLANYKVPELLVAVDAVLRNPLGETDRQALAEVVLGAYPLTGIWNENWR